MSQQPEHVPDIQAVSDPESLQLAVASKKGWIKDLLMTLLELQDPQVVADLESVAGSLDDEGFDESSLRESTASLSSSVREYRTIKGRTFQTSNTIDYWAPNDDKQLETLDVTHHFTLMLMDDNLFYAPVPLEKDNLKVLDVGTGTGIWAIDVADEFPTIEVIGTDISPVQPSWVPPNCHFQLDDAQQDWTFKRDHFDVIHARNLHGGIDDWQRFCDQAFTHLKPGGWFESMEFDVQAGSENPEIENDPNHIFKRWAKLAWEAGDAMGRTFRQAQSVGPNEEILMLKCMREAGFVDIVHKRWKVPIGGWAKDELLKSIGQYAGLFMDQSLDGWVLMPVGEILGWTYEEILVLVMEMRQALKNPKTLPYFNYHMVYGRKPEDATSTSAPAPTQPHTPGPTTGQPLGVSSPSAATAPAPADASPGNEEE